MRSAPDILELLQELDSHVADDLEDTDLDFKEWNNRSMRDSVDLVIRMAICMANGGGGTVVFGVADKVTGRANAIKGVPPEVDSNLLKKAVYDSTDPKLTPIFQELSVPEGTGRLLVMQINPGLPPYTDTSGRGTIRIGKDCQPLTGSLRRRIGVETGETDFTSVEVHGHLEALLSASALEHLREVARRERSPDELLNLRDLDLLAALGVIRNGNLTRAGLLIAGKESALQEHIPGYLWSYLRMQSDTHYLDRLDGREALPLGVSRITDRIMANNPIATVEHGILHFEYRTYPEIALREALMNAFCHADYRIGAPIIVKQFPHKLEIGNPGEFVGGISPNNILHHQPVARNPHLVDVLTRLRLVNRSNLGISRIFAALLVEGKEPPLFQEQGAAVKVTMLAGELSVPFRSFASEENSNNRPLSVDQLLILQYLLRHSEIDTGTAAHICQRPEAETRQLLSEMERTRGYLDRGGTGRGTYWRLRTELHWRLSAPGHPERGWRIDWEAAKTRVLSVLKQRAERGEPGLSNQEIRELTNLDRHQVFRLMTELRAEVPQVVPGRGRWARYTYER